MGFYYALLGESGFVVPLNPLFFQTAHSVHSSTANALEILIGDVKSNVRMRVNRELKGPRTTKPNRQSADMPIAVDTIEPAVLTAENIIDETEHGFLIASGNVQISFGDTILLADSVSYDRRRNDVIASGEIAVLLGDGDVRLLDYVELTGDLKIGVIKALQMSIIVE